MTKISTLKELAERVRSLDRVTILTHRNPDGDTIGAGFGLCYYLRSIGKRANVINAEPFPNKFGFLFGDYSDMEFDEESVVSVDVADASLLGDGLKDYAERVGLCIDHHHPNPDREFAREGYVDSESCATCLIIYSMLKEIGAEINPLIADCLYTGIATDTGCFMYENASPEAHRAAADLISLGARAPMINREMFQIKSKGRILSEQKIIGDMRFSDSGKIALICITNEIIDRYGVDRADLDGYASIPLCVEGVKIGLTLKQQPEDPAKFKASIRTLDADATVIAGEFGGGGHTRAAGCTLAGTAEEAAEKLIRAAEKYL